MIVLDLTSRARARRYRIYRQHTDYRGTALLDVAGLDGSDGLFLYAVDAETAVERARGLVRDGRNLIAIEQES